VEKMGQEKHRPNFNLEIANGIDDFEKSQD